MDHGVPGACAFEVKHRDGGRLLYTGDFRDHGPFPGRLTDLAKKVKPGLDVLLCEGTMLGQFRNPGSEGAVAVSAESVLRNSRGLVTFQCATQNMDRIQSLSRACERAGRKLALDMVTAFTLEQVASDSPLPVDGFRPLSDVPYRVLWTKGYARRLYATYGEEIVRKTLESRVVRLQEIAEQPEQWLLLLRPGMLPDLKRYEDRGWAVLNTIDAHLYGLWKGYRRRPGNEGFEAWLSQKGAHIEDERFHASGHAGEAGLVALCKSVAPAVILPIHTFHGERFTQLGVQSVAAVTELAIGGSDPSCRNGTSPQRASANGKDYIVYEEGGIPRVATVSHYTLGHVLGLETIAHRLSKEYDQSRDKHLLEARQRTLDLLAERSQTLVDWVRRLKVVNGLTDQCLFDFACKRGFLDEEIEGALISLERGPWRMP